jgi:hypothetical protein
MNQFAMYFAAYCSDITETERSVAIKYLSNIGVTYNTINGFTNPHVGNNTHFGSINTTIDGLHTARDENAVKGLGITRLLNCGKEEKIYHNGMVIINTQMDDELIMQCLLDVVMLFNEWVEQKHKIMITSPTTTDRSVLVLWIYMLIVLHIDIKSLLIDLIRLGKIPFTNLDMLCILIVLYNRKYHNVSS